MASLSSEFAGELSGLLVSVILSDSLEYQLLNGAGIPPVQLNVLW
jgi:hypothetical protein